MMITAIVCGTGAGAGGLLCWQAMRPAPPSLAALLAHASTPTSSGPVMQASRVTARLAAPAQWAGLPTAGMRADLVVLGRDPVTYLGEQVALILCAGLAVPAAAWVLGVPGLAPAGLSLIAGLGAALISAARTRAAASAARAQMGHTLSVMLTIITISLARGAGLEQALDEAGRSCTGPAAEQISALITRARLLRQPPWTLMADFGDRAGIADLSDMGAALDLAGTDGSRIRRTLTARSAALRAASTAAATAAAHRASSRLSLPLLGLGLAYALFLIYPSIALITLTGP